MKTLEFEVENKSYKVVPATISEKQEARRHYNATFRDALKSGAWLKVQSNDIARKTGVWSDQDELELQSLHEEVRALENKLEAGGYELEEAKKDAHELLQLRDRILEKNLILMAISNQSAEGQAQTEESDYLLYLTLKNEDGSRYCKDYNEYLQKREDQDLVINTAIIKQSNLDFWNHLPEIKFLNEYGDKDTESKSTKPARKPKSKPFLVNGEAIK